MPDAALASNMCPFELLLFGTPPRTSLDSLVSFSDEADNTRGSDNIEQLRRQNKKEVRHAMAKVNEIRMTAREKANASIARPSVGVSAERGSLVLVRTGHPAIGWFYLFSTCPGVLRDKSGRWGFLSSQNQACRARAIW